MLADNPSGCYKLAAARKTASQEYPAMSNVSITLTKSEAMSAAWALKANATEAYCDERLTVAATNYSLAARLFFAAGYTSKGVLCNTLAQAIDAEAIAIASGDDDAAEYASSQIIDLQVEVY
jgi:hypothetical protein